MRTCRALSSLTRWNRRGRRRMNICPATCAPSCAWRRRQRKATRPLPSTLRHSKRHKRDIQIKFRVTADERVLLERKMREAGTTNMGAYLRKMALDGYILRLDLPELKEMLSQLRYMGNNVNQIAKRANEVGVIDEMDIRGVRKRQERMLEQMARLLEKLSGLN